MKQWLKDFAFKILMTVLALAGFVAYLYLQTEGRL